MAVYSDRTIIASMHDFKTNLAKYTRMLECGEYAAVEVQRYNKRVGVFITEHSQKLFEARALERAEAMIRKDEMALILDDVTHGGGACDGDMNAKVD